MLHPGESTTFTIKLYASGQLENHATELNPSHARIHTEYSVTGTTGSSGTVFSEWKNFRSKGVAKDKDDALPDAAHAYIISATASVALGATPGLYPIEITAETNNPSIPSGTPVGLTLRDGTAGTLSIQVVPISTPLSIDAPADITVEGNTVNGAENVALGTAIASGGTSPYNIVNNAPIVFPLGSKQVTWTATDANGNTATDFQTVTVVDTTPPTIAAPGDITVEGNTVGGATGVALGSPVVSDIVDPSPTVTNDAPSFFPLGPTTVTWTATDASLNSATATQTVTVVDTTPPTITAPANKDIEGNTVGGANVALSDLGTATATDIVDSTPTITNNFAAGFYALGSTTTVTWTATDDSLNSASATQSFTVVDTTAPTITAPATLSVLVNAPKSVLTGTATDIVDSNPTLTNNAPLVFPPGTTTVTWTATDASGNHAHATTIVTARYTFNGFLPPINNDGSSIFKAGSTVPVKFQLKDYNGAFVSTAVASITYAKVSGSVVGTEVEAVSTAASTTGNLFRYDLTSNQYIFNLSTKGLTTGTYQIKAILDDGTSQTVIISLK